MKNPADELSGLQKWLNFSGLMRRKNKQTATYAAIRERDNRRARFKAERMAAAEERRQRRQVKALHWFERYSGSYYYVGTPEQRRLARLSASSSN
jgi:hypothetical protein